MPDPVTPTVSPTVASTIGLKNIVLAELTADTESSLTYGTLQLVSGAIEVTVTPGTTDPDVQYADDGEFDVLYPDPEIAVKVKLADLPLSIQEKISGAAIDANGVLIRNANDSAPYYAIGFKAEKTNHKYRAVWLYKCRAKPITETYQTKEGATITRQTGEVEFVAIKRTKDSNYQAIATRARTDLRPKILPHSSRASIRPSGRLEPPNQIQARMISGPVFL